MPIRKKSHKRLASYVQAHQRDRAWAEKAILYSAAGKVAQAKAAVKRARHRLRKVVALESQAARGNCSRGRRN
jgi:hypothetical protein